MAAKLKLEGKVAVVTGGASGIGEATVRLFTAHGGAVIIADIQDSLGFSIASSISPPGRCTFFHCDVRDELQVAAAVDHAIQTYGGIDIMLSNAGILGAQTSILDMDMPDLDNLLAIHVRGTASAIKHAGRAMAAARVGGSIICTASIAAVQGGFGSASYTAAKHAVLGLMRASAGDLGEIGVRVNCVSPSGVATPLVYHSTNLTVEEIEQFTCKMAPLKGHVLKAMDIAAAVLFLASDESAFISGQNILVDGGTTTVNSSAKK